MGSAIFKNRLGARFSAQMERPVIFQPRFLIHTIWDVEHYRNGKLLCPPTRDHNVCTDEGLNALLDIMFHGSTQITTWYIAIFETDTTPSSATTYAVPVYTECAAYVEAARQAYVEAAASSKVITNAASKATFTLNATKTIYGAALLGGGTAATNNTDVAGGGTIYAASKFSTSKSGESGDVLKITCSITSADA